MSATDPVLYEEKGDGIVVITLNEPKTRNALSAESWRASSRHAPGQCR